MKKNIPYNIAIILTLIVTGVIAYIKFIRNDSENLPPKTKGNFEIENSVEIKLLDRNHRQTSFVDALTDEKLNLVLIFDPRDCFSCIIKGINDLKNMKSKGFNCAALAISDIPEDVFGWAEVNIENFKSLYVVNKADFFNYIHVTSTPVMVTFNGKIKKSHYFIYP